MQAPQHTEEHISETFRNLDPAKQTRVLEAALDEFADHGFAAASVNRMAKRLAIAKGSLFAYFGSKEGLFHVAADQALERFKEPLRRVRDEGADKDFFERLEAVFAAAAEWTHAHPRTYALYLRVLYGGDFPGRERLLARVRELSANYLRPLIVAGLERGELRSGLDPDAVVFLVDGVLDRFLQARAVSHLDGAAGLHDADPDHVARRIADIMDILRGGLAAQHPYKESA